VTDPRLSETSARPGPRTPDSGSRTADYDFHLPPDRIARYPADRRDRSRLLRVDRASGSISHHHFADLVDEIPAGDLLVLNETKVFPARLRGRKTTGGEAEALLLHPHEGDERVWYALVRPARRLRGGQRVEVADDLVFEVLEALPGGERLIRLEADLPLDEALERHGEIPLPPYMEREAEAADRERYQTVYARERGSVAAPTAGLHFTPEMLETLEAREVRIARVVLHVGAGTFRPVEVEDPTEHAMHSEWLRVPEETASILNATREAGGAVWAVGTTVVRALESRADAEGRVEAGEGWTDIFIHPPMTIRSIDRLITNFHLPRSTLMMLVASLAGYGLTMRAYDEAIREGYRFYSYGDAMVIV
jgi:S-adenosylmethionine:tRNA ribosyltransferase-isomerase